MDDLSQIELIVNSSEQSSQRPKDKEEREKCYSGYKYNHTSKKIVVLPQVQDVIDVRIGEYDPKSDINIFREVQLKFKSIQQFKGGKAFIGGQNISTPHKKPKKAELAEKQNEENKIFSSKRIFIEHLI